MAAGAVHFHGRQARSGLEDGGRRIGGAVSTSCCARQARTRAARRAPWASASGAEVAADYAASERTCKSAGTALQISTVLPGCAFDLLTAVPIASSACAVVMRLRPGRVCELVSSWHSERTFARRRRVRVMDSGSALVGTTSGDQWWVHTSIAVWWRRLLKLLATRRAGCLPSWLRARCWQRA